MGIATNDGCIYILSGREYLIEECLESLFDQYNGRFGHPIYVYYFDGIYDRSRIARRQESRYGVQFVALRPTLPAHVPESELFWNRDNAYARKFGRDRVNYLHMCHWRTNVHDHRELARFRFHQTLDDDSLLTAPVEENLFERLLESGAPMATSRCWSRPLMQRKLDVRENLFGFYRSYLQRRGLQPRDEQLARIVDDGDEPAFHALPWVSGNCCLYDQRHFAEDARWLDFADEVNRYAGAYRHRWGDEELVSLYAYTHFDRPIADLGLVESGHFRPRVDAARTVRSGESRWRRFRRGRRHRRRRRQQAPTP